MADSKITALASIGTGTDPANDPLVIVDVSDVSPGGMSATGTTKKVTLNNLLACSPTAGGNFTITGDLTVRTNQLVVNSSGSFVGKSAGAVGTDGVQLLASGFSGFSASATTALFVNRNTSDGTVLQLGRSGASAADFGAIAGGGFTVGLSGSEWMRINATGLGVGASPSYNLDVRGASSPTIQVRNTTSGIGNFAQLRLDVNNSFSGSGTAYLRAISGNAGNSNVDLAFGVNAIGGGAPFEAMRIDSSGNVGIGVTPDFKLVVNGTQAVPATTGSATDNGSLRIGAPGTGLVIDTGVTAAGAVYGWIQARARTDYSSNFNLVLQPNGGNLGIGIQPITSHILSSAGPIGISGTNSGTRTSYISNSGACSIYYTDGGGSGFFTDFGNLIIQPRTSAARSVVIATGSTTPVERAVVKSTGQVRFVPLAADPAGAEAGDVYYNSTSNKLKCYNGTTWNDLF